MTSSTLDNVLVIRHCVSPAKKVPTGTGTGTGNLHLHYTPPPKYHKATPTIGDTLEDVFLWNEVMSYEKRAALYAHADFQKTSREAMQVVTSFLYLHFYLLPVVFYGGAILLKL